MIKVLIVGATSAIAQDVARIYAGQNAEIALWARNSRQLEAIKQDLLVRGAKRVEFQASDLNLLSEHPGKIRSFHETLGQIDVMLIAHGYLGDQQKADESFEETLQILNSNYLSYISLIHAVVPFLKAQKHGAIAVLSSVAGDRGKQSNFTYGSAKGGISIYIDGLRNRLFKDGVHALDFKLGFVDTPMTKDFKKGPLWAKPEQVAKAVVHAIAAKKDIVYIPFFWRYIMMIIKSIPEKLFKKLSL